MVSRLFKIQAISVYSYIIHFCQSLLRKRFEIEVIGKSLTHRKPVEKTAQVKAMKFIHNDWLHLSTESSYELHS